MSKNLIFFIAVLLLADAAAAATIHGTVYNLDLESQNNVIITVNSTPKQTLVSKDGTYTFILPEGSYKIKAEYNEESAEESVIIENLSLIHI